MSRTIIVFVRDKVGNPLHGAKVGFWVNKVYVGEVPSGEGRASIAVANATDEVALHAVYEGEEQKADLVQNQNTWTFKFDVDTSPPTHLTLMKEKTPLVVGLFLLAVALVLVFAFSAPTTLQARLILATASLAGGLIASEIPGMFKAQLSLGKRFGVGATGAAAVFVILYFAGPGNLSAA